MYVLRVLKLYVCAYVLYVCIVPTYLHMCILIVHTYIVGAYPYFWTRCKAISLRNVPLPQVEGKRKKKKRKKEIDPSRKRQVRGRGRKFSCCFVFERSFFCTWCTCTIPILCKREVIWTKGKILIKVLIINYLLLLLKKIK